MAARRNPPAGDAFPHPTHFDLNRLPKELRDMIWFEAAWQMPGRIFQLPTVDRLPTIGQVPPGLPVATLACRDLYEASKKVFVPVPITDQAGQPGKTVWIGPNDWLWVNGNTRLEGIDLPFRKLVINTDLRPWKWNLACSPSMLASFGASQVHVEELRVVIVQNLPLPECLPDDLELVDLDLEQEKIGPLMVECVPRIKKDVFKVHLTEQSRTGYYPEQYPRGFRFCKPGDRDFSWKSLPTSLDSWFVRPIINKHLLENGWYQFKWEKYSELLAAVWEENLALLDWEPNRPKVSRCIAMIPEKDGGARIL